MPAKSDPRAEPADSKYFYRRSLSAGAQMPAIGVGIAAGVAAFYVARLYLQRTPLMSEPAAAPRTESRVRSSKRHLRDG